MRKGSALLTSKVDCETVKDFYQYYKDRYFGYAGEAGKLWPAVLSQQEGPHPGHLIVCYWNPHTLKWNNADYLWGDFVGSESFRFGYPNLGTVPFGPTYAYLTSFPRRESAKGIGLYKAGITVPQNEFIFTKYIAKQPGLRKMLGQGGYYCTPEELELVMAVLNKSYYDWNEALHVLEDGVRLGCQLNKHMGIYLDDKEDDLMLSFKDIAKFARVKPYHGSYRVELGGSYKHLTQLAGESLYTVNKDLVIV